MEESTYFEDLRTLTQATFCFENEDHTLGKSICQQKNKNTVIIKAEKAVKKSQLCIKICIIRIYICMYVYICVYTLMHVMR